MAWTYQSTHLRRLSPDLDKQSQGSQEPSLDEAIKTLGFLVRVRLNENFSGIQILSAIILRLVLIYETSAKLPRRMEFELGEILQDSLLHAELN